MESGFFDEITDGITAVMSACFDWVSVAINKITEEPLLLFVVLIPFVSIGVSLLKKLIHVKSE